VKPFSDRRVAGEAMTIAKHELGAIDRGAVQGNCMFGRIVLLLD
jgi:hypothetical protein